MNDQIAAILSGFSMVPSASTPSQRVLTTFGASGSGGQGGGAPTGGQGGTSPPLTLPQPGQIAATTAVDEISRMYRALVIAAARLERTYGFLSLGARMPCTKVNLYNNAVRNYVLAAQSVFSQITARDPSYNIVQTVYDAQGKVIATRTGITPLMPPTIQQANCNRAPMLTASGQLGDFGEPVSLTGVLVILIVAAAASFVFIKVADMLINRPTTQLEAAQANLDRLTALQTCAERRVALLTSAKQPVPSIDVIDAFCEQGGGPPVVPPDPKDSSGVPVWLWATGGGVAVVGFLLLAKSLFRRDY